MNDEITRIINTLCEKLGVAAGMLIPELARYYIAKLTTTAVIFALVAVVFLRKAKSIAKQIDPGDLFDDGITPMIITTAVFGIAAVIAAVCTVELVGWIASPTAAAIEQIANLFN